MSNTFKKRVLKAYKVERAKNLSAKQALRHAKYEAKYGFGSPKRRIMPYRGETEVIELPNGWTAEIEIQYDEDSGPPWENSDGHGVVTDWQSRDENLEGWELNSDRSSYRYYDWRATLPIAIRDGWDAPPYKTGTPREQAMRAIKLDYEYLRGWCNGDWCYVGLIVTLKDENGEVIDEDSCWGYDAESDEYLCSEARSWLAHMLRKARKEKHERTLQARIDNRFHDAMENAL